MNKKCLLVSLLALISLHASGQGELTRQMLEFQRQQQAKARAQNAAMNQAMMSQYNSQLNAGMQWFQNGPHTEARMLQALEAMAPDPNLANWFRQVRMNGGIDQSMQMDGNWQMQQLLMQQMQMRQMMQNRQQLQEFFRNLQELNERLERRNRNGTPRRRRNVDDDEEWVPKFA